MMATDVNTVAPPARFTVLNVVLDSGERLPCLVELATWLPVRVASCFEVLRVFKDPLSHPDEWQWAMGYWDISDLHSEPEVRTLFDAAVQTIQEAGFDPVRFGRQNTEIPN